MSRRRLLLCLAVATLISLPVLYLFEGETALPRCQRLCPSTSTWQKDRLVFDARHSIRHFPDFVCPQNFRNLADWVFGWPNQFFETLEDSTRNGSEIAPCLPEGSIIYVRGIAVKQFFAEVYPTLINKFVLITGEGDDTMPHDASLLDRPDSKILHWFAQNGGIEPGRSSKFTHIPIGETCPPL